MFERIAGPRVRRAAGAAALLAAIALPVWAQQTWRTMTSARQVAGERRLAVDVEYGAGRLRVQPERGNLLYRMEMRYDAQSASPVTSYDRRTGRLRLGAEGRKGRNNREDSRGEGRADIALTPAVPMSLKLSFGAGEADVKLGGLALEELDISTGASETRISFDRPNRTAARAVTLEAGAASLVVTGLANARTQRIDFEGGVGETTLDFGGAWTRDARATVKMGLGSVTLRLPRTVGVRIVKESFLASFDSNGMVKRGNAWYSRGYERAPRKLDIQIEAALGSIEVDWID
ncbi:MAG TPA: LiaF domain-containing protein [Longimicrobium sp.]